MSSVKLHREKNSSKNRHTDKNVSRNIANIKKNVNSNANNSDAGSISISSGRQLNISDEKFRKIIQIVFWVITAVYGALCLYLYYKQSIQPASKDTGIERVFESDLPFHISMVVDDGWYYSLTAVIYLALYKIAGSSTVLIAIFLALVSAGTLLVTERLLTVLGIGNKAIACGGAVILNLVMPFYIKWAGAYRYISYQSGNVWHNSTYQCMKLAALGCMLLFLTIDKRVAERGIKVKEWIGFALALAACTAIKPSFLTVFAPAFAIKLLVNWLKDKVPFKRIFLWGITVIPACGVVLWQNSVLFGKETENGFTISFMKAFSNNSNHPKITVMLSLAFPIVLFVCYVIDLIRRGKIKSILEDRVYLFAILMALVGFTEAILLVETGSRASDGNFLWGYAITLTWLYLVSFVRWGKMLVERKWVLAGVSGLILAYQYVCGVQFFSMLMGGITYFMNY